MYITKEKFDEICKNHSALLVVDGDVIEALGFVQELLEAEADAIKAKEPYATNTIKRLNDAAYEVFSIGGDVENEEFFEEDLPEIENRVEFKTDSHTLSALVDGKVVYVLDSLLDDVDGMNKEDLRKCVGECLDAIQREMVEKGDSVFPDDELEAMRDMLMEAWAKDLGIELIASKTVEETLADATVRSEEYKGFNAYDEIQRLTALKKERPLTQEEEETLFYCKNATAEPAVYK